MRSPVRVDHSEPRLLVFSDFEENPSERALMDYINSVCSILLPRPDPDDAEFRHALRMFASHGGFVRVSEYFVIKALGKGTSFAPGAIQQWKVMNESERRLYRAEFERRYLSEKPGALSGVVRAIDRRVSQANTLLREIRLPEEDQEKADPKYAEAVYVLVEEAQTIASLARSLTVPDRTNRILSGEG